MTITRESRNEHAHSFWRELPILYFPMHLLHIIFKVSCIQLVVDEGAAVSWDYHSFCRTSSLKEKFFIRVVHQINKCPMEFPKNVANTEVVLTHMACLLFLFRLLWFSRTIANISSSDESIAEGGRVTNERAKVNSMEQTLQMKNESWIVKNETWTVNRENVTSMERGP